MSKRWHRRGSELARLQAERDRLDLERQRLERIQRALPAVAERKTSLEALATDRKP